MDRIKKFYEDLPLKWKIIVLIILAIVLLFLTRLMSSEDSTTTSNSYTESINYKEVTAQTLLENYTESYSDRDSYLEIKNIIEDLAKVYDGQNKAYKEYYEAVDSNYSKYLSRSKFMEKMNEIFSKIDELNDVYTISLYRYSTSIYIVELSSDEEVIGYIGIRLSSSTNTYYIFYLE